MTRKRTKPTAPASRAPKPEDRKGFTDLMIETNKSYGAGTLVKAPLAHGYKKHIPFGHMVGDLMTLGGLPENQTSMFLGQPGGGKTTQAMRVVAQALKKYPYHKAIWLDPEQTFDPLWAEQQGVDMNRLILSNATSGEQVVDLLIGAIAEVEELCIWVLDSANATIPMKIYEDSAGDHNISQLARLMGIMSSKVGEARSERRRKKWAVGATGIVVNQWRERIGGFGYDTKQIPCGRQLQYHCSSWIEFKAHIKAGKGDADAGMDHIVDHTMVNRRRKGASSIKTGDYTVVMGADHHLPIGSYDEAGTVLAQAKKFGLWGGGGQKQYWEQYPDIVFKKGADGMDWLEDHPNEALEIKRSIVMAARTRVGMPPLPADEYLLRW